MASIRRTLSPEYPYIDGVAPFSPSSISHKGSNKHNPSQLLSYLAKLSLKTSRGGRWRRPFYLFLGFFLLGFLLGMSPYGLVDDGAYLFSFENNPQSVDAVSLAKETGIGNKEKETEKVFSLEPRKLLIVVTPTYNRATQAYYLNRIAQTLRLVDPPLLWIVVEANAASFETSEILRKTGVMYRHLVCKKNMTSIKDRGVHQRNTALEHIELHKLDGIVYFADDDNIYSLELFESLRQISRFGTWPVAMLAPSKNKAILEGPVCNGSRVIGWHTNERSKRVRRFHVDMSGFAFNSTILWDPKRWGLPVSHQIRQLDTVKEGFQETTFIQQLVADESEMEGVPPSCSKLLNWHLHLDARNVPYPQGWTLQKNLEAHIRL